VRRPISPRGCWCGAVSGHKRGEWSCRSRTWSCCALADQQLHEKKNQSNWRRHNDDPLSWSSSPHTKRNKLIEVELTAIERVLSLCQANAKRMPSESPVNPWMWLGSFMHIGTNPYQALSEEGEWTRDMQTFWIFAPIMFLPFGRLYFELYVIRPNLSSAENLRSRLATVGLPNQASYRAHQMNLAKGQINKQSILKKGDIWFARCNGIRPWSTLNWTEHAKTEDKI